MNDQDAEIEWLKTEVSCAVLLERLPPVWQLDRAESTHRSLKYRRSEGEIVIVNHHGRGWWDPLSDRKGDIFTLVQQLDPSLNFGEARRMLRGFVGIAPAFPAALRARRTRAASVPVAARWERRSQLSHGSPAWRYLTRNAGDAGDPILLYPARAARPRQRCGPAGGSDSQLGQSQDFSRACGCLDQIIREFSAGGDKTLLLTSCAAMSRMLKLLIAMAPRGAGRRVGSGGDRALPQRHAVCRDRRRDGTGGRRRAAQILQVLSSGPAGAHNSRDRR